MSTSDRPEDYQREPRGGRRHKRSSSEADQLADLILAKLEDGQRGVREFVDYRYRQRLKHCESRSTWWGRCYSVTSILVVGFGLGSSAILALADNGHTTPSWARTAAILFGLAVGVLAGFNRVVRPGELALRYYRAETALRDAGWHLVNCTGVYAKQARRPYAVFSDQILGIEHRYAVAPVMGEPVSDNGPSAACTGGAPDPVRGADER